MSWLTAFLEFFRSGPHCFWSEQETVFGRKSRYPSYPARKPRPSRPHVEPLESRALLSTYTVDHLADDLVGTDLIGSLRYCITHATDGDVITFGEGVTGTINLNSALPNLTRRIDIDGPGADLLTVRGPQANRVFTVAAGAAVSIAGLSITGSGVPHGPDQGGGIYNAGTLTIRASTITHNIAQSVGGGIYNRGTLTLSDSTISGNTLLPRCDPYCPATSGGGIFNDRGTLTITNSTLAANLAASGSFDPSGGGGLFNSGGGVATIQSSTLAGNGADSGGGINNGGTLNLRNTIVAANGGNDLSGRLTTSGHNLIGNPQGGSGFDTTDLLNVDPLLGPLQNNGGPTQTMALLPGSPAIGTGDSSGVPDWDQRGVTYPRIVNGTIDIGAFEVQSDEPTGFSVTDFASPTTAGQAGTFTVTALDANGNRDPNYTGTVHFISTDPRAVLAPDYTFTRHDRGMHTFVGLFQTAGSHNLFISDTLAGFRYGSQRGITVLPGAADHYRLGGAAALVVGDTPQQVSLTAFDAFGNRATGYRGTVNFSSTDGQAILPADYTFTAADEGSHHFSVTLHTAGSQTVTVQDTPDDTLMVDDTIQVTRTVWLVASPGNHSVLRYDAETGTFIDALIASGTGGLSSPVDPVIGPDGNLYVSSTGTNSVKRYDRTTGAYLGDFVSPGSGGLVHPHNLIFRDGYLYVSGADSRDVLRYDATTGAFVDAFIPVGSGGLNRPHGLTFGLDGNLYVNSEADDSVRRYDGTTGAPLPAPGQTGSVFVPSHSGGLRNNYGQLDFGPDGSVYVPSWGTNNVLHYDGATGAFLGAFVPAGSGGLNLPEGLVFGPDGNLYVGSQGTNQVLRYDGTTGAFLDVFIGPGGALSFPAYLTYWDLDAAGPGGGSRGSRAHRVTASAAPAPGTIDSTVLVALASLSERPDEDIARTNASLASDPRSADALAPAPAACETPANPVAAAIPSVPVTRSRTHATEDTLFGAWTSENSALEPLPWFGTALPSGMNNPG